MRASTRGRERKGGRGPEPFVKWGPQGDREIQVEEGPVFQHFNSTRKNDPGIPRRRGGAPQRRDPNLTRVRVRVRVSHTASKPGLPGTVLLG